MNVRFIIQSSVHLKSITTLKPPQFQQEMRVLLAPQLVELGALGVAGTKCGVRLLIGGITGLGGHGFGTLRECGNGDGPRRRGVVGGGTSADSGCRKFRLCSCLSEC